MEQTNLPPLVESQPILKELAANPKKAIEMLKDGSRLEIQFFHGSRYVFMCKSHMKKGDLFPNTVFNALRELQLIKEVENDIFIYNE